MEYVIHKFRIKNPKDIPSGRTLRPSIDDAKSVVSVHLRVSIVATILRLSARFRNALNEYLCLEFEVSSLPLVDEGNTMGASLT